MQNYKVLPLRYHRATLHAPAFLQTLWPYRFPLEGWPSYCGAGDGFNDWIIPEKICGVIVSPACFIHDIEWTICEPSKAAAMEANWRFYQNLRNIVLANRNSSKYSKKKVEWNCLKYFWGVNVGMLKCFHPTPGQYIDDKGWPLNHPHVQNRLQRLANATLNDPKFYQ
jgi:hypothetical protein